MESKAVFFFRGSSVDGIFPEIFQVLNRSSTSEMPLRGSMMPLVTAQTQSCFI